MWKNNFKIAWRNLTKNKISAAINIFGLSIGLACCILMTMFVQHELSYDKFHKNAANIYRVTSIADGPNGKVNLAITPAAWAPLIQKDYPEVKQVSRVLQNEKSILGQTGKEHSFSKNLLLVDSNFFRVFSYKLLRGKTNNALSAPNTIVLTEEAAKRYFGNEDPMGKTIECTTNFTGIINVQVTGIVDEPPSNSHMTFDVLLSMSTLGDISQFWAYHMHHTYVLLANGASQKTLESKLATFSKKYIDNNPNADGKQEIHLQPLTNIHLHSQLVGELQANGNITYVYIFSCIALLVLLIACLNFMNLSTVRSIKRAKEVGMRKVAGAERSQLVKQFLAESLLVAFFALAVSLVIIILILPTFNQLSERTLHFNWTTNYKLLISLIALTGVVGLLAGIYPATVLSSFNPVEVLKGLFQKSIKGTSFRKVLVTLQFAISIALISSTILVYKQMQFVQNKKLGFDKEKVIVLAAQGNVAAGELQTFKTSVLNTPGVISVAAASNIPGALIPVNLIHEEGSAVNQNRSMQMLFVDHDFVNTLKMKVLEGRAFSTNYKTDESEGFIINQEAVKQLGWQTAKNAVGKSFQWVMPDTVLKSGKIIGVVEDFNITSLKAAVQPLVMHILPRRFQYLYIRVSTNDALHGIEKEYKTFNTNQPFEYSFLDDTISAMYKSERRQGIIFGYFSGLAIIIAGLGILGLSIFAAQQRIKEIGIRKVLGASVISIVGELSKEFLKPVLIAALIAFPIAWYAMHKWLQDFAYRIDISWWVFIVAGVIAICIALFTISFQAIKAALANPVKSLRTE